MRYYGPIDGHNLPLLIKTFEFLKTQHDPVILHIITEKGRGYRVVSVRARFVGAAGHEGVHLGKAAHVHLRWRDSIDRFVVVGLERDE